MDEPTTSPARSLRPRPSRVILCVAAVSLSAVGAGVACVPQPAGETVLVEAEAAGKSPKRTTSTTTTTTAAPTTAAPPVTITPVAAQPGAPVINGCKMLPDNNIVNTRVDAAPVHARSSVMINRFVTMNPGGLSAGASAGIWQGSRSGIPLNRNGGVPTSLRLDGSWGQPMSSFTALVPASPRIEGEPGAAWDRHLLVLDPATCRLQEHIDYRWDFLRGWVTGGSVWWDLRTNDPHTPFVAGGVPAEAASLPMAPLIYRYDDVAAGEIRHAIRFVGPNVGSGTTWPARRSDGRDTHADSLPMGSRLRLKASFDISRLGPQARVIANAMRRYGIVAADTGPSFKLTGEGDARWNDSDLSTLGQITAADFEAVDTSGWIVSPTSFEARPR
jgi:hypothetical protein